MDDETPLQDDPNRFVRVGLWFYGAMAILAVLWRVGVYAEPIWAPNAVAAVTAAEGLEPLVAWPLWQSLAAAVAIAAFVIALSWFASERTAWGANLATRLADQLPPLTVPDAVLLSLASGLAEEMFFRGALQPRAGLLLASLLFGVLHMPSERALWPWTGFALGMGLTLGWLFEASGSLVGPIVAHTAINAVNLPLLVRRYRSKPEGEKRDESS